MTISVDWPTGVVSVPKADTVLTGTDPISGREIRSYDTDLFHEELRDAEESVAGRAWPITHQYNTEVNLGGDIYAPQLIMVNSYQVEFENGSYRVVFTSTNNNIADFSVVNDVSIQPGNSAGLIKASIGASDLVEDYPVDGQSSATVAQMLYSINQLLSEFARSGAVISVKKRDGTEAFQLTLDSATAPTSSTQSS